MNSFQGLSSLDVLENHRKICVEIDGKRSIKIPEKGNSIKFNGYSRRLKAPFVIYADGQTT